MEYNEYIAVSNFISLVIAVAQLAIFWQLFEKAGVAGWKAIVPFYNYIVAGRIAGSVKTAWMFIGTYFGGLALLFGSIVLYAVYNFATNGTGGTTINILLFLTGIASIVLIFVSVFYGLTLLVKFAQAYTAGLGRWLVFIFLPLIGAFLVRPIKFRITNSFEQSVQRPIQ
jgi:hypothetical protein